MAEQDNERTQLSAGRGDSDDDDATRLSARRDDDDDATRLSTARAGSAEADVSAASEQDAADSTISAETVIKDRFIIKSVLGRGGMGVVYRALDLRKQETGDSDPYVALKVLNDQFRRDQRMVVALQREARKSQTLAHPNIATVYDFDRDDRIVFLTMEQLTGRPLDEVIEGHPQGMEKPRALKIIRGLCLGLAYAHNKHIVHSDFKPGNIFLSDNDETRILDFGIARAAPAVDLRASQTTQFDAGELGALTPSYASLEMFSGAEPHPADDVYALAIVAYQLLSGRHPFDFTPAPAAQSAAMQPRPIKGLKRREWRALQRGLAFERSRRISHASEFLRALEGSPRSRAVAAGLAVMLLATGSYVGYEQWQRVVESRPAIAFTALPAETQTQFSNLMTEAASFERLGVPADALNLYLQAYRLHPRNPDAVRAISRLFERLVNAAVASGSPRDADVLRQNLQTVMATDEFLATRPGLVAAQRRLDVLLDAD